MHTTRRTRLLLRSTVPLLGLLVLALVLPWLIWTDAAYACPTGGGLGTSRPATDATVLGDSIQLCVGFGAESGTDTLSTRDEQNQHTTDQVTTFVNGDVTENVAIVQANTKVYVSNITCPPTCSAANSGSGVSSFVPFCYAEIVELASGDRLHALAPGEVTAISSAVPEPPFDSSRNLRQRTGDHVMTFIDGNVGGNVVIVQANTTVDVRNLTVGSACADGDNSEPVAGDDAQPGGVVDAENLRDSTVISSWCSPTRPAKSASVSRTC